MKKWTRANYLPALPFYEGKPRVTASRDHSELSRYAATQGAVLLKNENSLLPLATGRKVALFGKGTINFVRGGEGSGEVYVSHVTNVYDGFCEKEREGKVSVCHSLAGFYKDWLKTGEPWIEPAVPESIMTEAAADDAVAVITISRNSGEGRDRQSNKGDFYLTDSEQALVDSVCENFKDVAVVLNIGGMIDTTWIKDSNKIGAALLAWQGGLEGGGAIADLLCGDQNPSGKLCDTFARSFNDYPSAEHFNDSDDYLKYYEDVYVGYRYFETIESARDKVCYPFGFGLSYTTFETADVKVMDDCEDIFITLKVKNTGACAGREVIQVYYSAPQGLLGKPKYELAAFKKTKLLSVGESEKLSLKFPISSMASYDDLGKIKKSAYVLEAGEYKIFLGNSVRNLEDSGYSYKAEKDIITEQLSEMCAPDELEKRMLSDGSFVEMPVVAKTNYHDAQPEFAYNETEKPFMLYDVFEGKCSLDDFICQMTDDELIHMTGGYGNTGVANTLGMGGIKRLGIPNVMTTDGPAGVRIGTECYCPTTCWPCATLVACSWDPALAREISVAGAKEVIENNLCIWLTPAINIHRNPLCGRNFEYLSEDPLLAGKIAAAEVMGMQSMGVACSVKHFACNNKETNRKESNSILSERALREIYLRAFEIVVKEADPWTIMTSYNKINGRHTSTNYELITGILRGEWGYKGMVTTDWSTTADPIAEILAGNDIKMPGRDHAQLKAALTDGKVTRGDIAVCAKRVLDMILKLN